MNGYIAYGTRAWDRNERRKRGLVRLLAYALFSGWRA